MDPLYIAERSGIRFVKLRGWKATMPQYSLLNQKVTKTLHENAMPLIRVPWKIERLGDVVGKSKPRKWKKGRGKP